MPNYALMGRDAEALMGTWYNVVSGAWNNIVSGPGEEQNHGVNRGGGGRRYDQRGMGGGHHHGVYGAETFGIAPRAALVEQRPPNMVNREPLPMSTGTAPVGIGLTAQITSRPQRVGFKPERLFVSNFSLDGLGATAWTINDITIGNVSQLAQAGNLPGDMFANVAIDSFVTFKTAQTAMDIVLITTYNGTTDGGIPFTGAVIGLSAQG
jgi:hypothetical protein